MSETTSSTAAEASRAFSRAIRARALEMVHRGKSAHIGSSLSMADLVAVLYAGVLRVDPERPDWEERDRFIVSKGHAAAIVYAALAQRGFFPDAWLDEYSGDGSRLGGHVTHRGVPGVEASTGSLGHGLPIGAGLALGAKRDGNPSRTFVMLSDGELDEGSNWEAVLFAPHHRLDNLVAIVDYNKIQSFGSVAEVLELDPLADKWRAFNWAVREVDGHDHDALQRTFAELPFEEGRPSVIIAHTVKGSGVSFMEDQLLWHYRPPSDEQLDQALREVRGE